MQGVQSVSAWLLFFYVYCVLGWCFESTYVSVFCEHRFVNRGFLTGPWLPLYGCGALVILLATLPVRGSVALTALVGMAAATALEYVTGAAMEAVFKVRYWDYSDHRFNVQGYICLQSTLAWGVLGVLLVNVLHRPVEAAVLAVNPRVRQIAALALTAAFSVDVTHSVITALDLKRLLGWLDGARGELKKLQGRIDAVEAELMGEFRLRRDQVQQGLDGLRAKQQELTGEYRRRLEQLAQELDGLKVRQEMFRRWLAERFSADKRRLLRRNPKALSKRYKDVLEKLREWQNQR